MMIIHQPPTPGRRFLLAVGDSKTWNNEGEKHLLLSFEVRGGKGDPLELSGSLTNLTNGTSFCRVEPGPIGQPSVVSTLRSLNVACVERTILKGKI